MQDNVQDDIFFFMYKISKYEINEKILVLTNQITENIVNLNNLDNLNKFPKLRKVSKIKSIQSSLAIENNSLTLDEVYSLSNGKKVIGDKNDILAIENAFKVYEKMESFDPYNLKDLLKAHKIMMNELKEDAGKLRNHGEAVVNSEGTILHLAPDNQLIEDFLNTLLNYLKTSTTPVLIKSCIFHYEFEYIHPFSDGNGRIGRFWQSLILSKWKPIFEFVPIESIIKNNQEEYYKAIINSNNKGDSTEFIEFILFCINEALIDLKKDSSKYINNISVQVKSLLEVMSFEAESAESLMKKLNLKSKNSFRDHYLKPALKLNLIAMEYPDKKTSKYQKYYKL